MVAFIKMQLKKEEMEIYQCPQITRRGKQDSKEQWLSFNRSNKECLEHLQKYLRPRLDKEKTTGKLGGETQPGKR